MAPTSTASLNQGPTVDGRRLRSERTRQAIIEAYLELLRRNATMPTATQIAEESGYAVRSVFERFTDLDTLSVAAADYALEHGRADAEAHDIDGDRPTRIRSHVDTRATACEKWQPLWRDMTAIQERRADLASRVVAARRATITRLTLMYGPELSTLGEPDREGLLIALATLVSFESWDQMRHSYGLSVAAAQSVWRSAIDRMLPATPD